MSTGKSVRRKLVNQCGGKKRKINDKQTILLAGRWGESAWANGNEKDERENANETWKCGAKYAYTYSTQIDSIRLDSI